MRRQRGPPTRRPAPRREGLWPGRRFLRQVRQFPASLLQIAGAAGRRMARSHCAAASLHRKIETHFTNRCRGLPLRTCARSASSPARPTSGRCRPCRVPSIRAGASWGCPGSATGRSGPGGIECRRRCHHSNPCASLTGNGRGPTRLMSPTSTFQSCGSSSMRYLRSQRPMGVMRASFLILNARPSRSLRAVSSSRILIASFTIDRNLSIWKCPPAAGRRASGGRTAAPATRS